MVSSLVAVETHLAFSVERGLDAPDAGGKLALVDRVDDVSANLPVQEDDGLG
jgi:hypothetical protein